MPDQSAQSAQSAPTGPTAPAGRTSAPPRGESLVPSPRMVWRLRAYFLVRYRRTWRASVVSAFLQPFLYLVAMGVLLGDYVDSSAGATASLGGESYLHFVAPGLLCATAMQFSAAESLWPVLGALKWDKTYHSMVAAPIGVSEIAAGAIADVTARTALAVAVFVAVLVPFGIFDDAGAVLGTLLVGVLTGLTSAALFIAYSVRVHTESNFGLMFRLGIFPLFLFSGAFFPVSNLPDAVEGIAKISPLWHAVQASRSLALQPGALGDPALWGHLAVLVVLAVVGYVLAVVGLRRRLVV
jgi:lipooligosaccharide transport system permease protein